jgi:hypothetical protein
MSTKIPNTKVLFSPQDGRILRTWVDALVDDITILRINFKFQSYLQQQLHVIHVSN